MNKRSDIGELAADMRIDTAYANAGPRRCRLIDAQGLVEIYGCVLASTSGFTRKLTVAVLPSSDAVLLIRYSSDSLSMLKQRIPASSAAAISRVLFPTPEYTTDDPARPA